MKTFQIILITSKFSWCMGRFSIGVLYSCTKCWPVLPPFKNMENLGKGFCTCVVCQVYQYNETALILKAGRRQHWWNLINKHQDYICCFQSLHYIVGVFRLSEEDYYKTPLSENGCYQHNHCLQCFRCFWNYQKLLQYLLIPAKKKTLTLIQITISAFY